MARQYRLGPARRAINAIVRPLTRFGLGGRNTYTLTVRGRKSGKAYSTPVTIMTIDERRYLVAPYGEVSWVRNARAAGHVELSQRGKTERLAIREVAFGEAVPVLRKYLQEVAVVRPYFDVAPDASDQDFARIAPAKPVFELTAES